MASWAVGHLEKVRALAGSGTMLAIGGARTGAGSNLTLFDLATKKVARSITVPSHVLALQFVKDRVVAGCADGWLRTWQASTGEVGPQALAHAGGCTALAVSSDGRLASVGYDGTVRLWALDTLASGASHSLSTQALRAVAFNGAVVAAAGDDAVVHALTLATGARRDMAGHAGSVFALAFTPRDGRLASAGDDGTVRVWFLDGAIESEVRGANEQGHAGGAFGFVFGPLPEKDPEAPDRLYSVGADAKVKVWRLDDRRKPKSFDLLDQVRAVAFVAPVAKEAGLGTIVAGGDGRTLLFITIGADGQPLDATSTGEHGFRALEQQTQGNQRPGREAATRTLAPLEEPEALALLLKVLNNDREPEVRALAAEVLAANRRRDARPALRERLNDAHEKVRTAALTALLALEPDQVSALKSGLGSQHPDVRRAALGQLPPHYPGSPLVPGLVQGRLTDGDATVRLAALGALVRLHPEGSVEPFRIAFERGAADLRVEAMCRTLMLGEAQLSGLAWMTGRALDDDDADVRRHAFAVRVLTRRPLATVLQHRFGNFQRMLTEVLRRIALARRTQPGKEVSDAELAEAKKSIGVGDGKSDGELADSELEPLLLAIACRTSDSALRGTVAMLSLLEDQRAIGALLQLSRDGSAAIRATVAGVLASLDAEQAEQRLVAMLEDADANVRAAAADGWAQRAGKARPLDFARGLLRSAFEDLRVRGLSALVQVPAGEDSERLLEHALDDESAKVRAEAFRTLWAWHQKTPQVALDRALLARFADLRLKAVEELCTVAQVPRDDEAKPPPSPAEWAVTRIKKAVGDRDATVGLRAFEAVRRLTTAERPEAVLLALDSTVAQVRVVAAQWAAKVRRQDAEALRSPLLKALQAEELPVRLAALDALDVLIPSENGPLTAGLSADRFEVKVRAGELLAKRHDEVIIEPLRTFLIDQELRKKYPPEYLEPLRARAASALATLGSARNVALFATQLIKDENPGVREQAARGLCNAGERHAVGPLLDALGHLDVFVRSWAAEGLARLGDGRGLPVLTGTLRDPHLPIREGAIRALVALGDEGTAGLLAGLDDPERRIQETFLGILLARDWRMYRFGHPPELLTAALASSRSENRFVAARALELRTEAEGYTGYIAQVLAPPKPEKASEMKDWPEEGEREHLMIALADQLGSEAPEARYAASQALLLRLKPVEYFAEVRRVTKLKPSSAAVVPDTTPRPRTGDVKQRRDWVRSLFASHEKAGVVPDAEATKLRWLAFGAYVGILREPGADEHAHRVRRDTIDRIVALAQAGQPPASSAIPPLVRALDDADHLVRRQAYAGLKRLLPADQVDTALQHALSSSAPDMARAALDELATRGDGGRASISAQLDSSLPEVRRHAFELLVGLSAPGSLEPLLAAFASQHSDLRLGVVERLAVSSDPRVTDALLRALESEHDDLRLRAAELLSDRRDDRAVPMLATFVRSEDAAVAGRARAVLVRLRTPAAVAALASRLDEVTTAPARKELISALKDAGSREGVDALLALMTSDEVDVAAFEAGVAIGQFWRADPEDPEGDERRTKQTPRDGATLVRFFSAAAKSKKPELRLAAAERMDVGAEKELDGLLVSLFNDRDVAVRVQAVTRYALRVDKLGADAAPLQEVLRVGARELMLPAAEGLASRRDASSFRPLLLFVRAGEEGERERALRALGRVGDARALEEMETVASGGTLEVPFDVSMQGAAVEGLGLLFRHLADAEQKRRVWDRLETAASEGVLQANGIVALQHVGDGRAVARLEQLALGNATPSGARLQAIDALGKIGETGAEPTLGQCLRHSSSDTRQRAKKALTRLFPKESMRVALLAADSPYADVAAPAIAFLVAEAEPAGLLERLANPLLPALRESLRLGLVRRASLPTGVLMKLAVAQLPAAREDVAWLMAMHALAGTGLSEADRTERAKGLAASALKSAERWARTVGVEKAAEERAARRLLWAAVMNAAKDASAVATTVLANTEGAPPVVRREAARALIRSNDRGAVSALISATGDRDAMVRRTAIAGVVKLDAGRAATLIATSKPLDALAFAGATLTDEQGLMTAAGRQVALPSLVARSTSTGLMTLVKDGAADDVKQSALAALGRMGGADVETFLESLAFTGEGGGGDDDEGGDDEEDGGDDDGDGDEDGDEDEEGGGGDVTLPGARRFEFSEGSSSKFWEIAIAGSEFTVRFGRIGTPGMSKPKDMGSPAAAQKEADKLVREKTGKGYEEAPAKGRKPLVVAPPKADQPAKAEKTVWGTEELRKAAFRAFKRAQRGTARRKARQKWFTPAEVDALAKQAQDAASGLAAPAAPSPAGGPSADPLAQGVAELELSVRSSGALDGAGITTVGALLEALKAGALAVLGRKVIAEVRELLVSMELITAADQPDDDDDDGDESDDDGDGDEDDDGEEDGEDDE